MEHKIIRNLRPEMVTDLQTNKTFIPPSSHDADDVQYTSSLSYIYTQTLLYIYIYPYPPIDHTLSISMWSWSEICAS